MTKVFLTIEGGVLQGIRSSVPDIKVWLNDLDDNPDEHGKGCHKLADEKAACTCGYDEFYTNCPHEKNPTGPRSQSA